MRFSLGKKHTLFTVVLDNPCFDLVFPCPRMIPREPTVLCGTEERQISHGHVSEARTSEQALFFERTDVASCLLPAFGTFLDEIYWICQRQDSKISFALLLLTTVMMFVSDICVINFYKDPLSTVSVSKTSWKLWLLMPGWKQHFWEKSCTFFTHSWKVSFLVPASCLILLLC